MIYFLQCGHLVKIGYSKDAEIRIDQLRTANPHSTSILGVIDGEFSDEASIHAQFEHLRERGEWFRLDLDLMEFIVRALRPNRIMELLGGGDKTQSLTLATREARTQVQADERSIYVNAIDPKTGRCHCLFRVNGLVTPPDIAITETKGQIA